ncbi:hypothetical protein BKA81DRAFT_222613 [Phyllosticta paracitricarpa]
MSILSYPALPCVDEETPIDGQARDMVAMYPWHANSSPPSLLLPAESILLVLLLPDIAVHLCIQVAIKCISHPLSTYPAPLYPELPNFFLLLFLLIQDSSPEGCQHQKQTLFWVSDENPTCCGLEEKELPTFLDQEIEYYSKLAVVQRSLVRFLAESEVFLPPCCGLTFRSRGMTDCSVDRAEPALVIADWR